MVETIHIKTQQQFTDWKTTKLRKDWQVSTILFVCEICKKEITIKGRNFRDFICRSCRKSNTESKKTGIQKQQELQKRKETLTRRYGTDVLMKIPGVAEKCKQIFLEKYGVENPSQSEEVQEKIKQTNIEKYGCASTNQVPFIKEKQNVKRINNWQTNKEKIISKKRNSLKEKYNNPFYNNGFKIKQTKKEKYGNENYNNIDQIKKTNMEKYGDESWSRTKEGRIRAQKQWLNMKPENKKAQLEKCKQTWAKKSPEELKQIRIKAIKKYGCYYIQTTEGKNKIKQYWATLSLKDKETRSKKCKQTWAKKSPEEKKTIREKAIKKYWTRQNNLSVEEKKLLRSKSCKKYKDTQEETFDSSWELALWVYAKDHALNIERESIALEYMFENRKHSYFPDFLFEGKLIEIKGPHFFKKDGTMQNPFDHTKDALFEAKHQCGIRNNVQFWGKKDIQFALDYMEETYGKGWSELFRKK